MTTFVIKIQRCGVSFTAVFPVYASHAVGILQMSLKSTAARSRSSKVGVHVQYIGCSTFQMALLDSRTVFYVISVFRCGRTVVLAFLGVHKQCRFLVVNQPFDNLQPDDGNDKPHRNVG